ncbi:hypothetical protein EJ02DRAFT_454627 [Clathrospora elynae]|uniref:GAR domain-containing protein n=1 Tax=Clathrospora elynae TaxID=706981 RepID=A0A6A5SQI8_9PLEO|nr:hypothetical protein EJ02DRAFT_454627 [Clathrospora elynae]
MSAFASPMRLIPPLATPRRAPSRSMSPGGRRGRAYGSSEESRLRDLSPETTLRAFTQKPLLFDTTRDEYKIFACIETLTAAERDLGARVAKAAQRLQSWCAEIGQWGWTGSFEQPSAVYREQRRRSIELRIREHVAESGLGDALPPLEYWGSLLSVEVEQHEARLDDIEDELLQLDVEELKEHVLDMHPAGRSRPSSAGYEASRQHYTVMDDFSFLITQTLLSALPHHAQLKDRLNAWTARVAILREAPRYLGELDTAQTAMRLGWDAIEPPADDSDRAFEQWKEAVDTISGVLQAKVAHLGRRLDMMLDTLEGHSDCLPDAWIDTFESAEADYGRWTHESRRRLIDLGLQRRAEASQPTPANDNGTHSRIDSAKSTIGITSPSLTPAVGRKDTSRSTTPSAGAFTPSTHSPPSTIQISSQNTDARTDSKDAAELSSSPVTSLTPQKTSFESEAPPFDDESEFEEEDTIVHNELDGSPEHMTDSQPSFETFTHLQADANDSAAVLQNCPRPLTFSDNPSIVTSDGENSAVLEPPQTPRSRRGSVGSMSSEMSFESSPQSVIEESPSVRNVTNRGVRAPRPELNAAMAKRRPANKTATDAVANPPWPPTRFSQKPASSADDLERKISDILTTIPAYIRLTSGPGPDSPEVKSRTLAPKGSRAFLRATRSVSGLKSPELTLSPAKSDFDSGNAASGRKSAVATRVDNDIKLYHLTQPGKEQPIKLFIRRVGENGERVMVRVGGGWSDLGEYLRQYAEHHGRRTASDGKFEILGLEVKNTDNSPNRPESVLSKRSHPLASPTTTPVKPSGPGMVGEEAPPRMPSFTSTPGIAEETYVSSTNSSQRSWQGNEVGLAGPKTKKLDLSGEKLEWIEGMMKQARTVSSNVITANHTPFQREDRTESRSESRTGSRAGGKKEFGDLGKVGGTKRIFLKGGKPTLGE